MPEMSRGTSCMVLRMGVSLPQRPRAGKGCPVWQSRDMGENDAGRSPWMVAIAVVVVAALAAVAFVVVAERRQEASRDEAARAAAEEFVAAWTAGESEAVTTATAS